MELSRPEYWSGYPFPSPGDLPNPGIKPRSPALQADSLPAEPQGKPKNTGVGIAYPFSDGSSQTRNRTGVSCTASGFFTSWVTREARNTGISGFNDSPSCSFFFFKSILNTLPKKGYKKPVNANFINPQVSALKIENFLKIWVNINFNFSRWKKLNLIKPKKNKHLTRKDDILS